MPGSHDLLKSWWSKTATEIVETGASEQEIAAIETRYGLSIPEDFRDYLRTSVPAVENWDGEDGNWWPIGRIRNIPEEYRFPLTDGVIENPLKHLVFMDHMQWCWAWAVSCADDRSRGRVVLFPTSPSRYVADSFQDFVSLYLTEWKSLIPM